jgi:EAL domain-containing protein (putative c-di-GMP-specific phosphodiesterase class I)
VTEDVVLNRTINETTKALGLLYDAGVSVALDDFGTGYASLIHLKQLPFDMLKIDRSFTLSLFEDDGQSEEIIRAIIGLGHGLRKQVVAEGVETELQRKRLIEMGCQLGQGFLFARPEPIHILAPLSLQPIAAA